MATPSQVSDDSDEFVEVLSVDQQVARRAQASAPTHKALSAFDARLLNGAARGLSPNELSRSIGGTLSPAECAVRVREMLADKSFWTDPERKQLLLHRVHQVIDDLMDISQSSKDSQDYSALIRALDLARKTMGEMEGATEAEMQAMVRLQAGAMLGFIEKAMARAKEILHEDFPDIDMNAIEEAFDLAMMQVREDRDEE